MSRRSWHGLLALFLSLAPAAASADVIMPFDGECFPGSQRGIQQHRRACIPLECEADVDCGEGAACETLCTCRAPRTSRSNGRIVYEEPRTEVVEVGFCDRSGGCAEGAVSSRRQCEPVDPTPAYDRERHRWTGESHVPSESAQGQTSPSGGACAGCAVPRTNRPLATPALFAMLAFSFWVRRRS